MRSLARILRDIGWQVSGSDMAPDAASMLERIGVQFCLGHAAENISPDLDLVVFSDAIEPENVELQRAGEWGIPTLRYFQALGALASSRETIAVAGTHGKSTVAAMAGAILVGAGADPTLAYGAEPLPQGPSRQPVSRAGRGRLMLVEACEYRSNFLHFHPQLAVLLGIEPDHFDCYPTIDQLEHAFSLFAGAVNEGGRLLVRHECARSCRVAEATACRCETFGLAGDAHWQAVDLRQDRGYYSFTVRYAGQELCRIDLRVLGAHQVVNALAAAAIGMRHGVAPERVATELSHFRGLQRRMEPVVRESEITWIDDYAHHPTEVAAALAAVREAHPNQRVCCVFQPHQASRTERLLDETAISLQNADSVLITEIFRAREPAPCPGEVAAVDLADAVRRHGQIVPPVHSFAACGEQLAEQMRPGHVLVTLGAGNLRKIGHEFFDRLREGRAAG